MLELRQERGKCFAWQITFRGKCFARQITFRAALTPRTGRWLVVLLTFNKKFDFFETLYAHAGNRTRDAWVKDERLIQYTMAVG